MATYSDDFNRADAANLGANWTKFTATTYDFKIDSGKARPTGSSADYGAYWNAGAFANDQYSEIIVGQSSSGSGTRSVGPAVRISGDNYYYLWMAGVIEIWKRQSGSFSAVDQTVTALVAAGDVIRFEAEGTTLRVIRNSSTIITKTDSSLSSGSAGMYGYTDNAAEVSADSWAGGDLGAAPSAFPWHTYSQMMGA